MYYKLTKKIGLVLTLTCFTISSQAQSNHFTPVVHVTGAEGYIARDPLVSLNDYMNHFSGGDLNSTEPQKTIDSSLFPLLIGSTQAEIKKYILTGGLEEVAAVFDESNYVKSSPEYSFATKITKNLSIFEVNYENEGVLIPDKKALYILENNKSVGVLMFNSLNVYSPENSDYFQQITMLKKSKSLKGQKKNLKDQSTMYYYADRNDDYIELYAVYDRDLPKNHQNAINDKVVLMQAYYPKYLEHKLYQIMIQNIKKENQLQKRFIREYFN